MKIRMYLSVFIFAFFLLSCSNRTNESVESEIESESLQSKVSLLDKEGRVLMLARSDEARIQIESIISTKKIMLRKILPLFEMVLVIEDSKGRQEWLVAKPNYIKAKNEKNSQIYLIENQQNLFEVLRKLSSDIDED